LGQEPLPLPDFMSELPPNAPQNPPKPQAGSGIRAFLTGAIIAGSALLGGMAVVLWNRKSLSRLRQPIQTLPKPSSSKDEDAS